MKPRERFKKLLSHTVGSIVSGVIVGATVLGAVTWDDISQNYDQYPEARSAFYGWVLKYAVLPGAMAGTLTYLFLPEVFRLLSRESSLSDRLRAFAEQRLEAGDDPEEVAIILNMADQAERVNA